MRHVLAPNPVATAPIGMCKPSPAAGLVAPARVTTGAPADTRGAVAGAINLAAVTATTDQRLSVAFRTHEQPGGPRDAVAGSADTYSTRPLRNGIRETMRAACGIGWADRSAKDCPHTMTWRHLPCAMSAVVLHQRRQRATLLPAGPQLLGQQQNTITRGRRHLAFRSECPNHRPH
jgi:hypothetical protein